MIDGPSWTRHYHDATKQRISCMTAEVDGSKFEIKQWGRFHTWQLFQDGVDANKVFSTSLGAALNHAEDYIRGWQSRGSPPIKVKTDGQTQSTE